MAVKENKMITKETWCDLSSVVETTARNIWKSDRLPGDLRLSFDELRSDCYSKCGYLVNNYRPGERSLKSYVFEYLDKKVIDAILSDYKNCKQAELSYIDAGTYNDKGDYVESHEYGEYEVSQFTDERKNIENKLDVNQLLDKMPKLDKMIAELIMEGKSYREIADEIGMSQVAVMKRMKKYQGVLQ